MVSLGAYQVIFAEILLIFAFQMLYHRAGLLREKIRRDLAPWHDRWEIRKCWLKVFMVELAMIAVTLTFFGLALYQGLAWWLFR